MKRSKLAWVVLVAGAAVIASAHSALAAGAFDVEIMGPGMDAPATVRWEAMADAVGEQARSEGVVLAEQEYLFFEEVDRPSGDLGPSYKFKLTKFIPTYRTPLGEEEWAYYPKAGVVRMGGMVKGKWRLPRPVLANVWNDAIETRGGPRFEVVRVADDSTRSQIVPAVVAGVVASTVVVALVIRKGKRKIIEKGALATIYSESAEDSPRG